MNKSILPRLPIGIQDFEQLRTGGFLYVDKTQNVYHLASQGEVYFLSRPRRFGKSLLCSTFKALFEGKRHLFAGTWLETSDWEWKAHPIIYLSMASIPQSTPEELTSELQKALAAIAQQHQILLEIETPGGMLKHLIQRLALQGSEKVVLLVDEYDKPLMSNLKNPALIEPYKEVMKKLYSAVKDCGAFMRFLFITGVSQFAKISIFSELNHLDVLSGVAKTATICGYTQQELETFFAAHLQLVTEKHTLSRHEMLALIKCWYNGYCFTDPAQAPERVYNPFSIINFFDKQQFKNYWFESGTATFVIDYFKNHTFAVPDFEQVLATENQLSAIVPEDLDLTTLMYQTGYLTIKDYYNGLYTLGFPNIEVQRSCAEGLLRYIAKPEATNLFKISQQLREVFLANKLDQLQPVLAQLCAHIPSTIAPSNERGYQLIFYLVLQLMGLNVVVEDPTALGRIDATVKTAEQVFIVELKIRGSAQQALEQIEEKRYDEKYRSDNVPICHIGIVFDPHARTVKSVIISA